MFLFLIYILFEKPILSSRILTVDSSTSIKLQDLIKLKIKLKAGVHLLKTA